MGFVEDFGPRVEFTNGPLAFIKDLGPLFSLLSGL